MNKLITYHFIPLIIFLSLLSMSCKDDVEPVSPKGTNAVEYGFSPTNTAEENVKALQECLNSNSIVYVDKEGVYDLDNTIFIDSNTKIVFGKNVYIRKQRNKKGQGAGYVFINKGAFENKTNENIEIAGLNLICNNIDDLPEGMVIQGLMGQVSFFYVKNLTIKDFTCTDLLSGRFCIQVAEFNNILIENIRIEGDKDGIHLGAGSDFVIRNGFFSTGDDPIALNAHDYDMSNPTVGWIENGLIENCYDLPYPRKNDGYFCRILAGSWVDWYKGMKLQKSDIVVSNGRLYRVVAEPDGKEYISYTPPSHQEGHQIIDGINWYMMQDKVVYNCGNRNIHFKNIFLKRDRFTMFSIHFDTGNWSRSYYPNSQPPINENLTFENIYIESNLTDFISSTAPVNKIKLTNVYWKKGNIGLHDLQPEGFDYGSTEIILNNMHFYNSGGIIFYRGKRKGTVSIFNSILEDSSYKFNIAGNVTIKESDVPYSIFSE